MKMLYDFGMLNQEQRRRAVAMFFDAGVEDDYLYELDLSQQVLCRKKKPDMCFVFLGTNEPGKYVGIVKKDETGYYGTTYDFTDKDHAKDLVDLMNKDKLRLSEEEVVWLIGQSLRKPTKEGITNEH